MIRRILPRMKLRRFGRLGWQVSEIGYGMWGAVAWSGGDPPRSGPPSSVPSTFGCNFFDTAYAYAAAQLQQAVDFHRQTFGTPPIGLWPSEGSVCPEMLPLVHQAGLRWFATDEGILCSLTGNVRPTMAPAVRTLSTLSRR